MPSNLTEWITLVGSIVLFLCGSGGVVALLKVRNDSKNGVRQENRADIDSLNARAVAIVENQFNYLITPLQNDVSILRGEVKRLEEEVKTHRELYQIAVTHIRSLYTWIARHMPQTLPENTEIPKPPIELSGDLNL